MVFLLGIFLARTIKMDDIFGYSEAMMTPTIWQWILNFFDELFSLRNALNKPWINKYKVLKCVMNIIMDRNSYFTQEWYSYLQHIINVASYWKHGYVT
jgi:hypothetical protein